MLRLSVTAPNTVEGRNELQAFENVLTTNYPTVYKYETIPISDTVSTLYTGTPLERRIEAADVDELGGLILPNSIQYATFNDTGEDQQPFLRAQAQFRSRQFVNLVYSVDQYSDTDNS